MAQKTPSSDLKYLLILDFEATCDDVTKVTPEIIELPTLVYDLGQNKVLGDATFHEYVRPTLNPRLTDFCVSLTGIAQVRCDLSSFNCTRPSWHLSRKLSRRRIRSRWFGRDIPNG
jgi:inhibitor of KinA sporulation pathway (predicted exonuclease)